MRVYQFTEQPYPDAWKDHQGSLRVNLPNRKCDPSVAADLFHRYYDEWLLADELGFDIMLNEHHQTATCMSSTVIVGPVGAGAADQARAPARARLSDRAPARSAARAPRSCRPSTSSRAAGSTWASSRACPTSFPSSNQNPVGVMERFWEAHDFIIKAMTSHDEPFNWESEHFHYRHVNIWPRPWQQPHPPVWSTTGSKTNARVLGEHGYVMATLGTGYNTRPLYDVYREGYMSKGRAGAAGRPFRLSRAGRRRSERAGSARARRARGELPPLGLHRPFAVPQSARIPFGRGQCAADARRNPAAQLHQGSPRHRHAQRQRAGADRRRHPVLRHARTRSTGRSSISANIAAAWATC